jgi:transcriptional regulator with XRE-family HTH domain
MNIGDRIRILRTNQKRTLQEVADGSELSKSMISKIENNKTVPSVAALIKIAHTLGTTISSLLETEAFLNAILTTKQKAEDNLRQTEKGYFFYPFGQEYHQKKCNRCCLSLEKEK